MPTPHPASPEARSEIVLGIVGGSGLYAMEELQDVSKHGMSTPFGEPSAEFTVGYLARGAGPRLKTVFVPRHGVGHRLTPSEINYRANIYGLKSLGVTHMLSVSAVGSLAIDVVPGQVVVPDQFLDRTKGRPSSFFGAGAVAHVQFGDPTDAGLSQRLAEAVETAGGTVHRGGTCVVMEGPAFSTRAESEMYRSFGARVIGMTALPEAKLAREAEMAYAMMALATDYDCWHQGEEEVSADAVIEVVRRNVALARRVVVELAAALPVETSELPYPDACRHALITDPNKIPAVTRERLDLIVGHYLSST